MDVEKLDAELEFRHDVSSTPEIKREETSSLDIGDSPDYRLQMTLFEATVFPQLPTLGSYAKEQIGYAATRKAPHDLVSDERETQDQDRVSSANESARPIVPLKKRRVEVSEVPFAGKFILNTINRLTEQTISTWISTQSLIIQTRYSHKSNSGINRSH
jgi:hypothetical protein